MTPSNLKYQVESHNPDSHFFTRETMRFHGDTMKNYGVCDSGDHWELFRKRPVKGGMTRSAFFDKATFKHTLTGPNY